jgi:diguanylate cyclase (GGDEF)-like protein
VGLLLLTLLATGRPTLALDPDRLPTQYARAFWRAPEMLPHDDVTSIAQTRDGYLWIGTVEGLARFDGVRTLVFDRGNTPAFTNNWVKAILEDRAGRLWVGTFGGGLVCRDNGRFVRYGAERGLPEDQVLSLVEDRGGSIWAGTGAGVYRLQHDRFVREPATEPVAHSRVRALLQDRGGTLWIGSDDGLYSLREGALRRLGRADGLSDDRIMAFAEDRGGLWFGTERGGVGRLAGDKLSAITRKDGLSHDRVWSLAVDRDDNLWIGTDGGGLDRLSHGRLTSFSTRNGLTSDYVWAIREDRESNLWVGTNGGGLVRLKDGRVIPITVQEGLPSDFIWAVRRTRDHSLWIGTEDAGLVRIQGDRRTQLTTRDGLASNQVKALLEDKNGSLWIGGNNGLDVWRNGRLQRVVPAVAATRINTLAEDSQGTLWIGSDRVGLLTLKPGSTDGVSVAGLAGLEVTALLAAHDGSVWVANDRGLAHIASAGGVTMVEADAGHSFNSVTALFEDPPGTIWAGTRRGLARIRDGVRSVSSAQGLFDDSIMLALPGNDGGLWLGGNRGLFRVGRQDVEDVMDGQKPRVQSLVLGLEDGLRSVEMNGAGSSSWKDKDGRLFLATRGGLATLDPSHLTSHSRPPDVLMEEVFAENRPLPGTGGWRLPAGSRRLTFHFTAIALRAPSRIRFARRLEGFDPDWVDAGTDRVAEYTNLPPGRYRFLVKAVNDDGVWSEEAGGSAFEIEPRLRETVWFRGLAMLLLVVAGPSFYVWRVRHLRRQKSELERQVVARTAELQAANALLAQVSREDPLTGVWNRRRLDEALEEEWRRAVRQRTSLGLLLLDVDYFKAFNDRLGHPAGDACLKVVAHTVAEAHRRAGELVARYGGEEFAVLIPNLSLGDTTAAAGVARGLVEALGAGRDRERRRRLVRAFGGRVSGRPGRRGRPRPVSGQAGRTQPYRNRGRRDQLLGAAVQVSGLGALHLVSGDSPTAALVEGRRHRLGDFLVLTEGARVGEHEVLAVGRSLESLVVLSAREFTRNQRPGRHADPGRFQPPMLTGDGVLEETGGLLPAPVVVTLIHEAEPRFGRTLCRGLLKLAVHLSERPITRQERAGA